MSVALSWPFSTNIVFQAVTSVEEFADISTDVVLQNKATTRVIVDELPHIRHKVVKKYKLASVDQSLQEFLLVHCGLRNN